MPAFFIPNAADDAERDRVYDAIVRFNGVPAPQRFYSISYYHNARHLVATVGEPDPLEGNTVIAILRDGSYQNAPYLICTPDRGVIRGGPIFADGSLRTVATPFTSD